MATLVGTQKDFLNALEALLELEYDAIEIYTAVIDRLENLKFKEKLVEFRGDHESHIKDIVKVLKQNDVKVKNGPSGKQILLIGGIAIRSLFGDKALLNAMLGAEEDTVTAYERMSKHTEQIPSAAKAMEKGLKDEQHHKAWVKKSISELEK